MQWSYFLMINFIIPWNEHRIAFMPLFAAVFHCGWVGSLSFRIMLAVLRQKWLISAPAVCMNKWHCSGDRFLVRVWCIGKDGTEIDSQDSEIFSLGSFRSKFPRRSNRRLVVIYFFGINLSNNYPWCILKVVCMKRRKWCRRSGMEMELQIK